jgi:hypothetical protein
MLRSQAEAVTAMMILLQREVKMNALKKTVFIVLCLAVISMAAAGPAMAKATRVADAIWAHGNLYDTVITPATFVSPPEHSTDTIFNFMMSGLMGQRAVADAAPRDRNYNGGRWSVYIAVFTAAGLQALDADMDDYVDFELTSADEVLHQVSLGHVEVHPANFYFECPMLPRKR